jgi:hypothetical protein
VCSWRLDWALGGQRNACEGGGVGRLIRSVASVFQTIESIQLFLLVDLVPDVEIVE